MHRTSTAINALMLAGGVLMSVVAEVPLRAGELTTIQDCNNNGIPDDREVAFLAGLQLIAYEFAPFSLDWTDSDDDFSTGPVDLPWPVEIGGETYTTFEQDSNGYVELVRSGESPYSYGYGRLSDLISSGSPNHTFLMAAYDDLSSYSFGEYGYDLQTDRVVFYWNTETYADEGLGLLNVFQIVLYPDGRVQWNFDYADYAAWGYDLFSGMYLGYDRAELFGIYSQFIPEQESRLFTNRHPFDCNGNAIPDDCDIDDGTSPDCNQNGTPDECECVPAAAPQPEVTVFQKNRYLSLRPGDPGCGTALRVTLTGLPAEFAAFEGLTMWAGEPREACENAGQAVPPPEGCGPAPGLADGTMWVAKLQCTPHYADWGSLGTVHLYHEVVVPEGTYDVQAIGERCDEGVEGDYSTPLTVATSRWGDAVGDCRPCHCSPPDGVVSLAFDCTAILDKFRNLPCAPTKARCDLAGAPPTDDKIDLKVAILDVTWCLDGFTGASYPFPPGPAPCP